MRRQRPASFALLTSWMLLLCSAAFPQAAQRSKKLPHPSGMYGVGRVGYDWVDQTRAERNAHDSAARREIMVYVWYPTAPGLTRSTPSEYLPHAADIANTLKEAPVSKIEGDWGSAWASILAGHVITDTYEQTPVSSGVERFPVLVFAPGFTAPSTNYTTLIQEVVSRGYVVASIEPTYDVAAVVFPDGRVIPFKDQWQPGMEPPPSGETWQEFIDRIRAFDASHLETWADDIRFVIDQLVSLDKSRNEVAPFAGRIDLQNIGTWGHSLGGRAAIAACQLDARIVACLSADGGAAEGGTDPDRPFMWIDVYHEPATAAQLAVHKITLKEWQKYHQSKVQATDERLRACLGGCYRLTIKIPGTDHYSFTDAPLLDANNAEDFNAALRALQPIEAYTLIFFDKYLKHRAVSVLDRPHTTARGIKLERYGKAR